MNSNRLRTSVGALALLTVCAANAQTVSGVATQKVGGGLQVQIKGQDLGQPKASWAAGKRSYTLTFDGKLDGRGKTLQVGSNGLTSLTYGWSSRKSEKVRVSFRLAKGAAPKLAQGPDGWVVNFNVAEPTAQKMPVSNAYPDRVEPIRLATKSSDLMAMNGTGAGTGSTAGRVSLDFVNTDIVQILKALALQANVNIVTSPEVAGKITVTLDQVSVKEALDMVTALGSVRYTKIGSTFIVTTNSRFSDTIQQIQGGADASSETRVVALYSGEGTQIKAAILKTVAQSTMSGKYDLVLPSDKVTVESKQSLAPADGKAGDKGAAGGADQGNQTEVKASSDSAANASAFKHDDYIVVVGTPTRLAEVEKAIKSVDLQICEAMGIKVSEGTGIVQRTFEPRGISAEEMLKVLRSDKSLNFGNVQILATPKESVSRQVVVISGRAHEVDNVLTMLQNLDSVQEGGPTAYEMVGLKHIKPQVAMVEVMGAVPGLRASILPPPVDPLEGIQYTHSALMSPGAADKSAGSGNGGNGGSGSGGSGSGGGSGDSGGGSGSGSGSGGSGGGSGSGASGSDATKSNLTNRGADRTTQYEADVKTFSTPMKLVLRGTKEQIERARAYLNMVDIAPKQVAVEVRVMELNRDQALKVGLDWSILTGGSLTSLRVNQGLATADTPGAVNASLGFKGGGTASILGALDSISNRNNLLARPNILLTDGVISKIFVGDTVRYVKSITSSQNGPTIVTDEINVGVDFSMAAKVGDEGNIVLDFNPVLSILQGFTNVPGGGQLPQTSVRSATSTVNIKSGETIAIGGLIQDQDRKNYGGIPILKDLPLIGRLFGRTDNERIRSEVVFFITVREVSEADRQGAANPRQAERDNKDWPGNKDGKKGG